MEKENPPVLMDLMTFHALKGSEAAGYHVVRYKLLPIVIDIESGQFGNKTLQLEETWCRGCAFVEVAWGMLGTVGNWPLAATTDNAEAMELLVGNEPPLSSIIALARGGWCSKCKSRFGTFDLPVVKCIAPKQSDRFAHDTWRTRNRGKIR